MFRDLLSPTHLVILLVIALLVFGPKRLPEMGAGIAKTIRDFRREMNSNFGAESDAAKSPVTLPPEEPQQH